MSSRITHLPPKKELQAILLFVYMSTSVLVYSFYKNINKICDLCKILIILSTILNMSYSPSNKIMPIVHLTQHSHRHSFQRVLPCMNMMKFTLKFLSA